MNLTQFIKNHEGQAQTAIALKVSQGTVSNYVTGRTKMTPNAVIDLETRSNGVMTRYDLLPEIFPR